MECEMSIRGWKTNTCLNENMQDKYRHSSIQRRSMARSNYYHGRSKT